MDSLEVAKEQKKDNENKLSALKEEESVLHRDMEREQSFLDNEMRDKIQKIAAKLMRCEQKVNCTFISSCSCQVTKFAIRLH